MTLRLGQECPVVLRKRRLDGHRGYLGQLSIGEGIRIVAGVRVRPIAGRDGQQRSAVTQVLRGAVSSAHRFAGVPSKDRTTATESCSPVSLRSKVQGGPRLVSAVAKGADLVGEVVVEAQRAVRQCGRLRHPRRRSAG
jgi:hypothetical protein